MNIFTYELKTGLPSMIYWTISIILLLLLYMVMYPAFSQDISAFESLLENFPLELRQALGMANLNFTQILGYYGFAFVYVLLVGSIYALKSSMSILSEDIRSKTADFLLAKPVKRSTIVSARILAVLTHLLIQNLIFIAVSYIIMQAYGPGQFDATALILINLSLIQVQLFFLAVGIFIATALKRIKTVLPMALGVVFAFFVIQMINQTIDDPKLSYITPFAYFDVNKIIQDVSYDRSFFVINLIIIIVLTGLTYVLYQRKDMPSI